MRKIIIGALVATSALGLAACSKESSTNVTENAVENGGEAADANLSDSALPATDNAADLGNGADGTLPAEDAANLSGNAAETVGNAQ